MNEIMYFTEASMEDSFVYKVFSDSNNILSRLLSAIKDSTVLDKSFFEEQYLQLKKGRSSSPFSNAVCEAFDSGKIEILYSDDKDEDFSITYDDFLEFCNLVVRNEESKDLKECMWKAIVEKDNTAKNKINEIMHAGTIGGIPKEK